jgi:hypothetical protein
MPVNEVRDAAAAKRNALAAMKLSEATIITAH